MNILKNCVQLYYTYVGNKNNCLKGVCLNILIDCVKLYYTYVGKKLFEMSQTVDVCVNILRYWTIIVLYLRR